METDAIEEHDMVVTFGSKEQHDKSFPNCKCTSAIQAKAKKYTLPKDDPDEDTSDEWRDKQDAEEMSHVIEHREEA